MITSVLDASAVLALLLGEAGADKVVRALPESAISAVNLAEIVGHLAKAGARMTEIHAILDPLSIQLIELDYELSYEIGVLAPLTRSAGLSLGDRACLALARKLRVPALTADRSWRAIAHDLEVKVEVIR